MDDEYLIIEHDFRTITIPEKKKSLGVVGDANVNRLRFKAPRYYGDSDLSEFEFRVNYVNANGDEDSYPVADLQISDDDSDELVFSWLVGRVACAAVGDVAISVYAYSIDGVYVDREYYTLEHTMTVLPTISTVAAALFDEYPDAIQALIDRIVQLRAEVTFGEGMDVDRFMSLTSENPVRNYILTAAILDALDVTDGVLSLSVDLGLNE